MKAKTVDQLVKVACQRIHCHTVFVGIFAVAMPSVVISNTSGIFTDLRYDRGVHLMTAGPAVQHHDRLISAAGVLIIDLFTVT